MIPTFIRAYEASAAIAPYTIVRFSEAATTSRVAAASAAGQPIIGTTGKLGATAAGQMVDITLAGLGAVQLGGPVSAGDMLTSDANGKAIVTTTQGNHVIGKAHQPGVAGDIIDYFGTAGVF
jgi:hypothetical protein